MKGWRQPWLLPPGKDIHDALCDWYYQTGDERTGDIPMCEFQDNVVVYELPLGLDNIQIPIRTCDPYKSSFFLFYTWRPLNRQLSVWGGISWLALYRLDGFINVNTQTQQNRAFLPIIADSEGKPKDDAKVMFYLPMDIPRKHDFVFPDASIEDIKTRFEWILSTEPRSKQGVSYAPSVLALGLFECSIENVDQRALFHTLRMQKEKHDLEGALQNFTETDFIRLFIYNGLENYMDGAMTQDVEREDLFWFWFRMTRGGQLEHPKNTKPPTVVFRVPMEECPVGNVPLQKYGVVHLTYKELGAWLWQVFVTQFQKMAFNKPILRDEEERWLKPLRDRLEKIDKIHISTPPAPPHPPLSSSSASSLVVEDMEDLIKVAPPCVANCMTARRFVYNNEAVRLLPILQEVGVSFEAVSAWMEKMNQAYPHPTTRYKDANARRNINIIWEKPKRSKQSCSYIVQDTLDAKSNTLTCPYAKSNNPTAQCSPDERFPWFAPSTIIRRKLKRYNKIK